MSAAPRGDVSWDVSGDRKFTFSPAKKLWLSFDAELLLLLKLAVDADTLQEN